MQTVKSKMKKFLICDTETTGLPISYTAPFTDTDNWPRIIELAWELCWENGETIEKSCELVYPDGWRYPTGEFWEKHGFNEADNILNGVDMIILLTNLAVAMNCADVMVCYNMAYDKPIIECEFFRYSIFPKAVRRQLIENDIQLKAGLRPEGVKLQKDCAKLLSTPILKLPGFNGQNAWPKLEVAYEYMFSEKMPDAHHASADVEATKKVYLWIKAMEDLM